MDALVAEYKQTAEQALQKQDPALVRRLIDLNKQIADQLQTQLAVVARASPQETVQRQELLEQLRRIQQDYDGLTRGRDTLETLRRIRMDQEQTVGRTLTIYLVVFLIVALLLLVVLFFRGQDTTSAIPTSVTMTTPLT